MLHLNDTELLEMAQKGQENAFAVLYHRYKPVMLSVARKKFFCQQEAEDIIQEIFSSFWQRRDQISVNISIKQYLLKAVHFQYAYKCRNKVVAQKYIDHLLNSRQEEELKSLENKEIGQQIRKAMQKITAPACRKIFELAYFEDKSCSEIAASLNIQTQVVRNQTSRALKLLRRQLKQVV